MAKIKYEDWSPREAARQMIQQVNEFIDDSLTELTVRGLHYLFVTNNRFENT